MDKITLASQKFGNIVSEQMKRVDIIRSTSEPVDYSSLSQIIIGVVGGDGIGPVITNQAVRVLKHLLDAQIKDKKVIIRTIEGLTIKNRIKANKAIPDDILDELKKCHVILKGPTTTPDAGGDAPNIESANVAMRKELDLFANVRPVCVPELGIDWTFFRENTEGAYILGSSGIDIDDDLAFDFVVTTTQGTDRIVRAAFEYASTAGKTKVTAVTKANVVKTTDGKFLRIFRQIAKEYPDIAHDDWYIDIMTAKLIDDKRRRDFQVFVLPNLYGDILTDEAAEFQGGVGTAGSANIGSRYAMFEAIHGSAPRMIEEGREKYADPSSMLRASQMLLSHIGFADLSARLQKALDICSASAAKLKITGRSDGATNGDFCDYVLSVIASIS